MEQHKSDEQLQLEVVQQRLLFEIESNVKLQVEFHKLVQHNAELENEIEELTSVPNE